MGKEENLIKVISESLPKCAKINIDKSSNLIATMGIANSKEHILLDAHLDQIGLVVTNICDGGFLKVAPYGGMDRRILPGTLVMINGKKNICGIISSVPPHLSKNSENKFLSIDELLVDTGLISKEVNELVKKINEEVGIIDILVNNAGIIKRIPMCEMSAEEFRQVIDVDLNAPFIVSKAVIPGMIEKGHGKIINICSMMSELGRETVSAYAAAKGGLKMLTRNICSEYGEANIQCNGIGPGYIATPQTAPLREKQADGSCHPFDQFIVAKTPAGRWGTPEDLMGPAVFLASDASNFVNGHILYVDGGILAYIGKQPQ